MIVLSRQLILNPENFANWFNVFNTENIIRGSLTQIIVLSQYMRDGILYLFILTISFDIDSNMRWFKKSIAILNKYLDIGSLCLDPCCMRMDRDDTDLLNKRGN
eukprot:TRINITY_DN8852_c0_g1_i1.p1 TRINITY_DN8852_c0_g1~~TRINITY_DN8852_c0_g1_i1.p1  ORF type:complete len:104 (+),score=0.89 TRINITY_DN8852_c0_g1_i1:792-1103(+)